MVSGPVGGLSWMMQAIKGVAAATPRTHWAEVAAVQGGVVEVVLDDDVERVSRPVSANAAGPVVVGQRVLLLRERARLTIIGAGAAPWTSAVLLNGWKGYGMGYAYPEWRVSAAGVELKGLMRSGTVGQPAFRVGVDPGRNHILTGLTYTGSVIAPCRISISAVGDVTPDTGANPAAWVSISGLTIPTL